MTPLNRRAALAGGIGGAAALVAAALAGTPSLAMPAAPDAYILMLSAEVLRCGEAAAKITAERIEPFEDEFLDLIHDHGAGASKASLDEAFAFSGQCGRGAAVDEVEQLNAQADSAFNRMLAIPATTQAGRAAKVRALLVHVMPADWRGEADDLDWPQEMARALLGEFAGLSAEELAAI